MIAIISLHLHPRKYLNIYTAFTACACALYIEQDQRGSLDRNASLLLVGIRHVLNKKGVIQVSKADQYTALLIAAANVTDGAVSADYSLCSSTKSKGAVGGIEIAATSLPDVTGSFMPFPSPFQAADLV